MTASRQGHALLLLGGFAVWGSAFAALYAALSLGCAWGWDARMLGPVSLLRGLLLLVLALHLLVLAILLHRCWRSVAARAGQRAPGEPWAFLGLVSLAATGAALVSTLWTGLPVLGLSACT